MAELPLCNGGYAIVDEHLLQELKNVGKWRKSKSGDKFYVKCKLQKPGGWFKWVYLHRFIKGLDYGEKSVVDHINGNTFDNRLENLRICTTQENCYNSSGHNDSRVKTKGVSFTKEGRYRARIYINGKEKHLGVFCTEKEAKFAYEKEAKKHQKDFAFDKT